MEMLRWLLQSPGRTAPQHQGRLCQGSPSQSLCCLNTGCVSRQKLELIAFKLAAAELPSRTANSPFMLRNKTKSTQNIPAVP